jgi:tetratricopeptide (TPR) repeat protein
MNREMFRRAFRKVRLWPRFIIIIFILAGFNSCASQRASREAAQAETYFTIGMAFFELGRFTEAETWLNRARQADRTMVASEYNLGRIAFERGRFAEAARFFEIVIDRDPDNVMALQAAAFMRIRSGDLERAEELYNRVLELVPESADDGFNYALVLYGLEKFEESEEVLKRYPHALEERASSILLLARVQKAMYKVEAIDSYAKWLIIHTGPANPLGIYEYAQVLERAGHYARALEQFNTAIEELPRDTDALKRSTLHFAKARLLLSVDPNNEEGMEEFRLSMERGFTDTAAIEALLSDERITSDNRDEIRRTLTDLQIRLRDMETTPQTQDQASAEDGDEADDDDEGDDPW